MSDSIIANRYDSVLDDVWMVPDNPGKGGEEMEDCFEDIHTAEEMKQAVGRLGKRLVNAYSITVLLIPIFAYY